MALVWEREGSKRVNPYLDTMVKGTSFSSQNFLKSINPSVNSTGRRPSVPVIVLQFKDEKARVEASSDNTHRWAS